MTLKIMKRIAQGKPVNYDERIENLEKAVESRIMRLEDAVMSMRDIVIKLNGENESLRSKQNQNIFEPFMKSGEDIVQYLSEDGQQPKQEVKEIMHKQNNDMERAISQMRQRFGLPGKVGSGKKAK